MTTNAFLYETGDVQHPPLFHTDRFTLVPMTPSKVRELVATLLQDEKLAAQIPWMEDKSADGAMREAFLLELQCGAGTIRPWGIIERERRMWIGTVLARSNVEGIDVEVLCASAFWNQGVADEVFPPVSEWLSDITDQTLDLH